MALTAEAVRQRMKGRPLTEDTCAFAAASGDWALLQGLRSFDPPCPWDAWTCAAATRKDHTEMLHWMHAQNCPWDEWTFGGAAARGDLDLMGWLRTQGCPWGVSTMREGISGGLEALQWLRSNGCPWDETAMEYATHNLEILQWLHSQGCPWSTHVFTHAVDQCADWTVLHWLKNVGCPWDVGASCAAARQGKLDVLQWLRSHGCPWDAHTLHMTTTYGHYPLCQWALQHGLSPDVHGLKPSPFIELRQYYQARVWLQQQYGLRWSKRIKRWLRNVKDVSQTLLEVVLITDVVSLVLGYC